MPRLPHGAETLIEQVRELRKSAKYEQGDPDGYDVVRSITFDKATSTWLGDALDYIDDDRIADVTTDKGLTTVHFHADSHIADQRDHYPLEDAITVAEDEKKTG
jgi:hypothetical protein